MGIIEYYLLFAFSTSITACYLWFWPLVQKAREQNIINAFTTNPYLSTTVYIMISAIIAPVLILPLLISSVAESFERGLSKEIMRQD